MGIYDRDYIRDDRPHPGAYGRGGVSGLRMWSVNTWIIVACVAVFVIDGFMPLSLAPMAAPDLLPGRAVPPDAVYGARPASYTATVPDGSGGARPEQRVGYPILTAQGELIGWQQAQPMHLLEKYLHFSTYRGFFKIEFWRLIGFQFLHAHGSIAHILFNMIGLFFFGPIVERYLGRKRYLAFYLLCGIFGALAYCLLNLGGVVASMFGVDRIPGLLFNSMYTPLIGASAGVFGVLMAGAYLAPNATVLLFFFLPMRLRTFAYAIVAVAFLTVFFGGNNAGGEAGHLGGAVAGFYLIRHPRHLHGFFDILGRIDPTSHHYRGRPGRGGPQATHGAGRKEIDRILDKISSEGLHALTEREKRILRQASER